jgi:hypothetical protein
MSHHSKYAEFDQVLSSAPVNNRLDCAQTIKVNTVTKINDVTITHESDSYEMSSMNYDSTGVVLLTTASLVPTHPGFFLDERRSL